MKRYPHDGVPEKRSAIAHLILVIHFPGTGSLKEKRQLLSGLVAKIRDRYPVSCAETGYQDLWQRALVEVVMVSEDSSAPERVFEKILDLVRSNPALDLLDSLKESL